MSSTRTEVKKVCSIFGLIARFFPPETNKVVSEVGFVTFVPWIVKSSENRRE